MKKIPCLFVRDFATKRPTITEAVTPGCEWVLAGEGTPTRKWDGTACLVRDGKLLARYDAKQGKAPPPGWEPCQPEADPITRHWPGWVLVTNQPQYKWHKHAFDLCPEWLTDGTYELCGPKIGGNPECMLASLFLRHGADVLVDVPLFFAGLREWLGAHAIEGIVWHHPDGRMAKLRRADFGFAWPPEVQP